MNQQINEIHLSDVKNDPKGRCIDCGEFIPDNENMKACSCKSKEGYVTMNALRKLACKEYFEIIRPEFHDYLLGLGYKTKDILDAIKHVREHLNKDYSTKDGQLSIEVLTRDILEELEPKNTCPKCQSKMILEIHTEFEVEETGEETGLLPAYECHDCKHIWPKIPKIVIHANSFV